MTKEGHGAITPIVGEWVAYRPVVNPAGFSLEVGAPNKFKGDYSAGDDSYFQPLPYITPAKTNKHLWWTACNVSLTGTPPVGVNCEVLSSLALAIAGYALYAVRYDDDEITFNLYKKAVGSPSLLGTGTTRFSTGATIPVLTHSDHSRLEIWFGSPLVKEFDIDQDPTLGRWTGMVCAIPTNNAYTFRYWHVGHRTGDVPSDRPAVSVETVMAVPASDHGGGNNDYGGKTNGLGEDCSLPARGLAVNWDDWGAGNHNGDTDYNCEQGGAGGREISVLGTAALSRAPDAAVSLAVNMTQVAAKTVASKTILKADDDAEDDQENPNIAWDSWGGLGATMVWLAPPSGTWADYVDGSYVFNGAGSTRKMSLGVESYDDNEDNDMWTAIGLEVGSMGDDPGADVSLVPRRPAMHALRVR